MQRKIRISQISLSKAASRAVLRGHPWIFGEGESKQNCGELVEFLGADGEAVGWGLVDEGPISHRVLGLRAAPSSGLTHVISERIQRADRFRFRFMPSETDAYRVISGSGDGLPGFVVDRYANVAVLRLYSKAWERHLDDITDAIRRLPWVETIWRKFGVARVDAKKGGVLLHGPELPQNLVVREHGIAFVVRPITGQKTGLFLDQRAHRDLVRQWANGRQEVFRFANP